MKRPPWPQTPPRQRSFPLPVFLPGNRTGKLSANGREHSVPSTKASFASEAASGPLYGRPHPRYARFLQIAPSARLETVIPQNRLALLENQDRIGRANPL